MKTKKTKIKREFKKITVPRMLSFFLVGLLYLFVGEIFAENFQWSNPFLAVVPGSIYLVLSSIAYKRAKFGGGLFVILGVGLVLFNIWQGRSALAVYVLALITFALGFLFIRFNGKVIK